MSYATIRELLGADLIGLKLLEVTQHDEEYFQRTGRTFVDLMFEEGHVLRIYITKEAKGAFMCLNPNDEAEAEMFG